MIDSVFDDARVERTLAGFRKAGPGHRNCAQTVMHYMYLLLGQEPSCVDIARFMGGGMARSGRTCGVVTGAMLAMGALTAARPELEDHMDPGAELRGLLTDFETEFGSIECRLLTGCDFSRPEELDRFRAEGVSRARCDPLIVWMCERLRRIAT